MAGKMTNKKDERIELHCHSKDGGNATMYAGELIRYADMKNMPAIAITDRAGIRSFPEMESVKRFGMYSIKSIYGMEMPIRDEADEEIYTLTVLVRNETGKENLYRIISETEGGVQYPVFEKNLLYKYREGLIIGSGAENGKLRRASIEGASDDVLRSIIRELDYIELLPFECDRKINEHLLALADAEAVPAVAVSDAHFLEKKDKDAWKVINLSACEPKNKHGIHLLTTEEMMSAFSYLSADKARQIVIDNTHLIASSCEEIKITPDKRLFPGILDADDRLSSLCNELLDKKYPAEQMDAASDLLKKELAILSSQDMSFYVLEVKELLEKSRLRACDVSMRGTASGSIVLYLLGISEVDPIKYDLHSENIYGMFGERYMYISLNVPADSIKKVHRLMGTLEGVGDAIDIGNCSSVSSFRADELVEQYQMINDVSFEPKEKEQICGKIMGNYSGWEPNDGGIFLFPKGCSPERLMPVQKMHDGTRATYNFSSFHYSDNLLRMDIYGLRALDVLRELEIRTDADITKIPIESREVLDLFVPDENGRVDGILDITKYCSEAVRDIVSKLKPKSFNDLVKIFGLCHGTGVWTDNAEKLVSEKGFNINDLIAHREDVYEYLMKKGMGEERAFEISEGIRKGKLKGKWFKRENYINDMKKAGVEDWYIRSCEKIAYLFPRAHSVSYVLMYMRLGWFKVNFPKEYSSVVEEFDL